MSHFSVDVKMTPTTLLKSEEAKYCAEDGDPIKNHPRYVRLTFGMKCGLSILTAIIIASLLLSTFSAVLVITDIRQTYKQSNQTENEVLIPHMDTLIVEEIPSSGENGNNDPFLKEMLFSGHNPDRIEEEFRQRVKNRTCLKEGHCAYSAECCDGYVCAFTPGEKKSSCVESIDKELIYQNFELLVSEVSEQNTMDGHLKALSHRRSFLRTSIIHLNQQVLRLKDSIAKIEKDIGNKNQQPDNKVITTTERNKSNTTKNNSNLPGTTEKSNPAIYLGYHNHNQHDHNQHRNNQQHLPREELHHQNRPQNSPQDQQQKDHENQKQTEKINDHRGGHQHEDNQQDVIRKIPLENILNHHEDVGRMG